MLNKQQISLLGWIQTSKTGALASTLLLLLKLNSQDVVNFLKENIQQ